MLGQPRGLGKAKHVDMQNLWIQDASKSGRFITRKVGTNMNPVDLVTKPLAKPKIEQLMGIMGYEFVEGDVEGSIDRNAMTWSPRGDSRNLALGLQALR